MLRAWSRRSGPTRRARQRMLPFPDARAASPVRAANGRRWLDDWRLVRCQRHVLERERTLPGPGHLSARTRSHGPRAHANTGAVGVADPTGLLDSDWVNCPADVAHLREARSPRPGRATRPRRGVPLQDGPDQPSISGTRTGRAPTAARRCSGPRRPRRADSRRTPAASSRRAAHRRSRDTDRSRSR